MNYRDPSDDNVIRVLVADTTRIHSQLIADAIRRDHRMEVVGSVSRTDDLLAVFSQAWVDIVVLSSRLEEQPSRGFEALRQIRALRPTLRAVMLLESSNREAVVEAFRSGAKGVFPKSDGIKSLCKCIRCVHEGQVWANRRELTFAMEALSTVPEICAVDANGINLLSTRELDVVRCLAQGLTNSQIGQSLGLSKHTVKNYLLRIFDKMGVSNRMELLSFTLCRPGVLRKLTADDNNTNETFEGSQEASQRMYLLSEKSDSEAPDEIIHVKKKVGHPITPERILSADEGTSTGSRQALSLAKAR
jgi:two-component system nitrate/nitrite response regulator NarL